MVNILIRFNQRLTINKQNVFIPCSVTLTLIQAVIEGHKWGLLFHGMIPRDALVPKFEIWN